MAISQAPLLAWLLEPDDANPGVRYRALQQLVGRSPDDPEVAEARAAVMRTGPVPAILAAQEPAGYWVKPGPGYAPKYRGTDWQLIQLHQLGADPADERVQAACEYVLAHTPATVGGFGCAGSEKSPPPPSSVLHCLNGNLLAALIGLGWLDDERVQAAIHWQALAITGEEADFAYYKTGTSAAGFACGVNEGQPCGWGATKSIAGLLVIPAEARSPSVTRALERGAEFLLSRDPAVADYPYTGRVSSTWFKLGMPFSYWSDFLETLENLANLGHGADARLDYAFELLQSKLGADGRWRMENSINGKTWADVEKKGQPSKWVTLRALRTLRKSGRIPI